MRRKAPQRNQDPPVRPQLYISVLLMLLMIILAFMGQWDWVLAVFIGLLVGNGLTSLNQRKT
jgi:hypothetical protein